jgi:hypothetical protein
MVLYFQRILDPNPPLVWTPLRTIALFAPIVQTAPTLSRICVAVGTMVPSGDALVPPGTAEPTLIQPDPVHCHQLLSMPST